MAQLSCCGVEFKNEEELARHQAKAHGQEKKVVGKHCGQDFTRRPVSRNTCGWRTGNPRRSS